MESIMEQIRTGLQKGESTQELIKKGFKRTTVYSVARKMKVKIEEDSDDLSLDRDIYLARIMEYILAWAIDDPDCDISDEWQSIIKHAAKHFEDMMGRKPPKDFLTVLLNE